MTKFELFDSLMNEIKENKGNEIDFFIFVKERI